MYNDIDPVSFNIILKASKSQFEFLCRLHKAARLKYETFPEGLQKYVTMNFTKLVHDFEQSEGEIYHIDKIGELSITYHDDTKKICISAEVNGKISYIIALLQTYLQTLRLHYIVSFTWYREDGWQKFEETTDRGVVVISKDIALVETTQETVARLVGKIEQTEREFVAKCNRARFRE